MALYKESSHAKYDIKYHFVWGTKYRYKILKGNIAKRIRSLLIQGCEANNITIIRGAVGKDHVHMLLSCPPSMSPSEIMKRLKVKTSRMIQDEFPELKKRY